jgi:glucosylglycerate phosphorylase
MTAANPVRDRNAIEAAISGKLHQLYDKQNAARLFDELYQLWESFPADTPENNDLPLSEKDAILIAYGDHVKRPNEAPLKTLLDVMQKLALPVSSVHILPFYPYSSDDGFSVIDYYAVDPALGDWKDIHRLGQAFRLMVDAVFNHISAKSEWFQAFLRGEPRYTDYFIVTDPAADLSLVTRPRTLPLLTPYETPQGTQHVWTTFSDDQIDLNAANPDVLLELIEALLFYVRQGAQLIRLDAIAFLWKRIGTTCIHLPETHLIIQLMRDVLDLAAPRTILITETNVPHAENISYFGDGTNEAQMVYQFPLPPLILHTLHTGSAKKLTRWAAGIQRVSHRTTFFNFTASHDGIGVRPATGILSDDEIKALVERTQVHGGHVSYKNNSDGSQSPYELNITYFDAITDPKITADNPDVAAARFMVSQAIMLAFLGVPGIYFHSLFGSRNDHEGVKVTGRYRTINREKLNADDLLAEVQDEDSLRNHVFSQYANLIRIRANEPAFHPLGHQKVLVLHPQIFALERISPDGTVRVLALHNVSGETVNLTLPVGDAAQWKDVISGATFTPAYAHQSHLSLVMIPYRILWLRQENQG